MSDRYKSKGYQIDPHHCHIGVKRFDKVEKQVGEMHPKVMNGLSDLPGMMKWGFGIIITLLVAITSLSGATRVESGRLTQQIEDHIARDAQHIADDRLTSLEYEFELLLLRNQLLGDDE